MSILVAVHMFSQLLTPGPQPGDLALVRDARVVGSTALVCLAAHARLPLDTTLNWLKPLAPLGLGTRNRYYLTFDATPVVLTYDMDQGLFAGVAPPGLLWPLAARPKLFAGVQGRWRAQGVNLRVTGGRGPAIGPIGYGAVLVRGNLLCHTAAGEAPLPELSFLVTAERNWGITWLCASYPCKDDRDYQAQHPNHLHFRRAMLPVGPAYLVVGSAGHLLELAWWWPAD